MTAQSERLASWRIALDWRSNDHGEPRYGPARREQVARFRSGVPQPALGCLDEFVRSETDIMPPQRDDALPSGFLWPGKPQDRF
jgi:hypothetical protein